MAKVEKIRAWWGCDSGHTLGYGDGRAVKLNITHAQPDPKRPPKVCQYGMHASIKFRDVLSTSPGQFLYLVDVWGSIEHGATGTKFCGKRRRYVGGGLDCGEIIENFLIKRVVALPHVPTYVKKALLSKDPQKTQDARSQFGRNKYARWCGQSEKERQCWTAYLLLGGIGYHRLTYFRDTLLHMKKLPGHERIYTTLERHIKTQFRKAGVAPK